MTVPQRLAYFSMPIAALLLAIFAMSQQPAPDKPDKSDKLGQPQDPQPIPQSRGMATGGAHAPVRDALHRPITAGGFVDNAPVIFTDITKQSGLDKFRHRSG